MTSDNLSTRFAFDGSFNIHLFIGYIKNEQPELYITKNLEVGFTGVFASAYSSPCANCHIQRQEGLIYEDAIPISPYLFDYLTSNTATDGPEQALRTLESFRPEHVVPFLKANIGWRVTDIASNLIDDPAKLIESGLEVLITMRNFRVPNADEPLGVYDLTTTAYPEITEDKVGGFGYQGGAAAST